MSHLNKHALVLASSGKPPTLPPILGNEGEDLLQRVVDFFTASIENKQTRDLYLRTVLIFLNWAEAKGATLHTINPPLMAAYLSHLQDEGNSTASRKTKLSALKSFFRFLREGGFIRQNPAADVRAPKVRRSEGKTPALLPQEMRQFIDSIEKNTLIGLRDRTLVALMGYTFARVSTALRLRVKDFRMGSVSWHLYLIGKGGEEHRHPLQEEPAELLLEWLEAANFKEDKDAPLFQGIRRGGHLTGKALDRRSVWKMVRTRAEALGLEEGIRPHSLRATGITAFILNGGKVEDAQYFAGHADARTTELYNQSKKTRRLTDANRVRFE